MKLFLPALIFFISISMSHAQVLPVTGITDSASLSPDSITQVVYDTAAIRKSISEPFYTSPLTSGDKPLWYDIEQQRTAKNDAWIFFILLQLLIVLVVLKLAFHNDFGDLFRAFANANIASQIGRSSRDDVTLSSVLMNMIFITSVSVFTRFVVLHFYPHSALQNNFSIVILIFLFTFFSVAKYASLKFIGNIFDIAQTADEYLFNLSAITRTIGISMIPILFMFYAAPAEYFYFILAASVIVLCIGVVMLVIRGLSTSYRLMYNGAYHFLIYICLCEILPIFLLIKLLTKTAI